jgi:hypothetical protein
MGALSTGSQKVVLHCNGTRNPTIAVVERLAKALRTDAGHLLV